MTDELKDIGLRLAGLRESLSLSQEEFAKRCGVSLDEYKKYESGETDMKISTIKRISQEFNIDSSILLFGEEPKMSNYYLTRKGQGLYIDRVESYKYQTLAGGFNNRKAEIFEVTIEAKPDTSELHLSSHNGHEFNLVLEGRMLIEVDGKELILEEGDSIYFDSAKKHGMKALDGKRVKFLAVVL